MGRESRHSDLLAARNHDVWVRAESLFSGFA